MQKQMIFRITLSLALASMSWAGQAAQQNSQKTQRQQPSGRSGQGMGGNFGTIASVGSNSFEMKTRGGTTVTVQVNDQTRIQKGQAEAKLEDLKAGDHVMVRGERGNNNEFVADGVRVLTEEDMARFRQRQQGHGRGEIVAIDNNQLTVRNQAGQEKTVTVNDQTTIMKNGQKITLKELKVGDRIMVMGKEANGNFVAEKIMTGQMQRGGGRQQASPQGGGVDNDNDDK